MPSLPVAALILAAPSFAGPLADVKEAVEVAPAATADEIPVLAELLDKAGWESSPEMTGNIRPGDIYSVTSQGHRWQGDGCIGAAPRASTYTQVEVTSQLNAGVKVGLGRAGADVAGSLVKKMKFETPQHLAIAGLELEPSDDCKSKLRRAAERGADLQTWYIVKETLSAVVTEQTCGQVDAGGRFSMLAGADADLAMACSQTSLEPVTVAIRKTPVFTLVPDLKSPAPVLSEAPAEPTKETNTPSSAPALLQQGVGTANGTADPVDGNVEAPGPTEANEPAAVTMAVPAQTDGQALKFEPRLDGYYACMISIQPTFLVFFPEDRVYVDVVHLAHAGFSRDYQRKKEKWGASSGRWNSIQGGFQVGGPTFHLSGHLLTDGRMQVSWEMSGINSIIGKRGTTNCTFVAVFE